MNQLEKQWSALEPINAPKCSVNNNNNNNKPKQQGHSRGGTPPTTTTTCLNLFPTRRRRRPFRPSRNLSMDKSRLLQGSPNKRPPPCWVFGIIDSKLRHHQTRGIKEEGGKIFSFSLPCTGFMMDLGDGHKRKWVRPPPSLFLKAFLLLLLPPSAHSTENSSSLDVVALINFWRVPFHLLFSPSYSRRGVKSSGISAVYNGAQHSTTTAVSNRIHRSRAHQDWMLDHG